MAVIENPIINSPYKEPEQHYELDPRGNPTGEIISQRRKSTYLTPIPQPRKQTGLQSSFFDGTGEKEEENYTINQIRQQVKLWRQKGYPFITRVTRQLLEYWTAEGREKPLFFCQIEAVETVIYITEVAKREKQEWIETELRKASDEANPGLYRMAFKMATGSGKTVVMAMLIAWQALNKFANSSDARFSDTFLIVTPGVTIRDRLRVLLPGDAENYYRQRDIVPSTLFDQLHRAKIVITNYHAFLLREIVEASALTKKLLTSKGSNPFTETPGQMVRRVCRGLGDAKNIVVINDEAHHCYDRKRDASDKAPKGEIAKEVEERRVWVNGIRAVQEKIGVRAVYDLSATPFFLAGSGYREGELFPWVVSDFALIDAIESGIVKIPRLPVADDAMQGDLPAYRNLWSLISDSLPKRKDSDVAVRPELPKELEGALHSLYGSYKQYHTLWAEQQQKLASGEAAHAALPPPVMIVVCNNTLVSKMVFDWISGYDKPLGEHTVIVPGNLELFRNENGERWLPRPTTILVDSQQLESGDSMSDDFKKVAAREIDVFKTEFRQRYPDRDPEELTDHDLLREVMNTVGKAGKLGEHVKCVISVSMLTEGWDVNSVTHILGVRAFSTQLICEQVIGRALRRISYVPNEENRFDAEYAEVYGVPFSFLPAAGSTKSPRLPRVPTHIAAMPERANAEFRFPNVIGYRYELNDKPLSVNFSRDSYMVLSSANVPTFTESAPLIGESSVHTLDELYHRREKEVVFLLAKYILERNFRDDDGRGEPKVWYFPQILQIVQMWIDQKYVEMKDGCRLQLLLLTENAYTAAEKIYRAIVAGTDAEQQLKLILDPTAPIGSSSNINFETVKNVYRTSPHKCQVNYVAIDSGWEAKMAQSLEMMPEVLAYVKNDGMNLKIPYTLEGHEHNYIPDFIVRVDMGTGELLNLIVEVTGIHDAGKEAKADTMRSLWIPGVNGLDNFGRWEYIEILDPWDAQNSVRRAINQIKMTEGQ
jgi:type III restriction enzyme